MTSSALEAARAGDERAFAGLVAPHRRELTALCYRMSGSIHDAEDLVQEAMLRAWKGLAAFEGRASFRTWLYRVTTNVCLNAIEQRKARQLPTDLGPPGEVTTPMQPQLEPIWLEPCPAELFADQEPSPEARYTARESITLAFLAALQHLPARQRALLVLHDVLGWSAAECAESLELSQVAVNSALQRARATLEARAGRPVAPADDSALRGLLERYVRAWEASDLHALVSLLHEDATLAMPPIPVWLRGPADLEASMAAMVFASAGPGTFRIVATIANGEPALAVYSRDATTGAHRPYALQLVRARGDRVASIVAFLDPSLFLHFGLPATLP
ncbi:MAG: sigma-70 family RNA polymerase sigma factor [Kofleriaceae bacterium]